MPRSTLLFSTLALLVGCAGPAPKEFTYLEKTPVVITELHFDPSKEQGQGEFIEIANVTKEEIDLSGWQVTGAKRTTFAEGTRLGPRKVLVICQQRSAFRRSYGDIRPAATFRGKLSNKGETVRVETSDGLVADEASYDPSEPEVKKAAGTGLSLHRTGVFPVTWRAAEPNPGHLNRRSEKTN
jgi:hypothetical protein